MLYEEVLISDPSSGYEIEYTAENTKDDGSAVSNVSAPLTSNNNAETTTAKRKIPIIRKPGEIVNPLNSRASRDVTVSPLSSNLLPAPDLSVRKKVDVVKVKAHLSTDLSTSVRRMATVEDAAVNPESKAFDHEYAESAATDMQKYQTQMDRIEKKLDKVLEKLYQHDTAFKAIKRSMQDLRVELKNSVNVENVAGALNASNAPPSKRKRLVCFPVADDNYLLRLEDLLQADDQIRNEVSILFKDAPRTSVYEFFRKNIYALFENCSKYTWTGKPSNAMPSMPPANVAGKMALVDHLITCAGDVFPHLNREFIAKDFRRALANFNDAVYTKRRKRKEMKLQNAGSMNDSDTNADADFL